MFEDEDLEYTTEDIENALIRLLEKGLIRVEYDEDLVAHFYVTDEPANPDDEAGNF